MDSQLREEDERALGEGGDGFGLLVAVQLAVSDAAVVVDDRVHELPADAHALFGAGAVTHAGDAVPGPREASKALGVHLQQIAGARPLKPDHRLARRFRDPGKAVAAQNRVDRRVCDPGRAGDQPRSPAGPLALGAHSPLDLDCRLCR
jgi:hypothetical protein